MRASPPHARVREREFCRGTRVTDFRPRMAAPRGISVCVQGPVSGLALQAYRLPMSRPVIRRTAQWHVDTPQQTLTVAGAAQELRRLKSSWHAPVSRLTPPKKFDRGTRERGRILPHRHIPVAFPRATEESHDQDHGRRLSALRQSQLSKSPKYMPKHIQKNPLAVDFSRFSKL